MKKLAAILLLLALAGCGVSEKEFAQAIDDDVRFSSRVMGFALDAHQETLETQLALLAAFEADPRRAEIEKVVGSAAEIKKKIDRVKADKQSLIEEAQRLRARYRVEEDSAQ